MAHCSIIIIIIIISEKTIDNLFKHREVNNTSKLETQTYLAQHASINEAT